VLKILFLMFFNFLSGSTGLPQCKFCLVSILWVFRSRLYFFFSIRRRLEVVFDHIAPRESVASAASVTSSSAAADEAEFCKLRSVFLSGKTRKFSWRRQQLQSLVDHLKKNKVRVDVFLFFCPFPFSFCCVGRVGGRCVQGLWKAKRL
jgi:hypothetical protein